MSASGHVHSDILPVSFTRQLDILSNRLLYETMK